MRASLFVAIALLLLGLAWLVSRGGTNEGHGFESSRSGEAPPVRGPAHELAATPGEETEERAEAAAEEAGEGTELIEEPESRLLMPWGVDRRRSRLRPRVGPVFRPPVSRLTSPPRGRSRTRLLP